MMERTTLLAWKPDRIRQRVWCSMRRRLRAFTSASSRALWRVSRSRRQGAGRRRRRSPPPLPTSPACLPVAVAPTTAEGRVRAAAADEEVGGDARARARACLVRFGVGRESNGIEEPNFEEGAPRANQIVPPVSRLVAGACRLAWHSIGPTLRPPSILPVFFFVINAAVQQNRARAGSYWRNAIASFVNYTLDACWHSFNHSFMSSYGRFFFSKHPFLNQFYI